MGSDVCLLITVYCKEEQRLLKCAIKYNSDKYPNGMATHWAEPENKRRLHGMLHRDIQMCGPIVTVEPIDEVCFCT